MRELIHRVQVDRNAKVFNVSDEFLIHTFKAHLLASVSSILKLGSISDPIEHENSLAWLRSKAEQLVNETITASESAKTMHRAFLHVGYLYMDLRNAIRFEDGPQVIRHYKMWLPRFLGTERKNYAVECVRVICNLCADFPRHMAYIATHNRTVSMRGKVGHGKPIDQMVEHYNL